MQKHWGLLLSGSPPLARGARHPQRGAGRSRGLTPARAGSTGVVLPDGRFLWAHPRSRGEHLALDDRTVEAVGSPPLARGARDGAADGADLRRLTPARAGSTLCCVRGQAPRRAHPRSRGEHHWVNLERILGEGSPPLARGALPHTREPVTPRRLTPARAGSTAGAGFESSRRQAHPRSRGEHSSAPARETRPGGSPPLARGALVRPGRAECRARLTPARAGSTAGARPAAVGAGAHPRSRGEHDCGHVAHRKGEGSPPLARGALARARRQVVLVRLTPARAGSTAVNSSAYTSAWAHPRSRGEHWSVLWQVVIGVGSPPVARGARALPFAAFSLYGSPPLARGAPGIARRRAVPRGLTPARAGSTRITRPM